MILFLTDTKLHKKMDNLYKNSFFTKKTEKSDLPKTPKICFLTCFLFFIILFLTFILLYFCIFNKINI